ncbi:hypothetical protein SpAn4DRAFT_2489 [Sporomusa ovata]|uniref:Uncharacterized protein n=1 Tax=Sporomusa ovata TaxID=2378 RepID=A0A0U1L0R1_9FIRM|nr:hypothetical protein SpAn4DRAFT_2489 [Sporomusa ovata]
MGKLQNIFGTVLFFRTLGDIVIHYTIIQSKVLKYPALETLF